jgi:amidase
MSQLSEYSRYDGFGLAALVRRGEVTPRELADAAFAAIERLNPKINAVTMLLHDLVDQTLRGELPDGLFKGVPFLAKDLLISYAGIPTTSACRLFEGYTRNWDSELVRRFKKSGVVTIGKTNTPELGMNASTEPVMYGPTRNPWDLALTAGGSSGGSAAAVAAGIVPMAHANDGGGSTRIPAACTGLVGLKPSRGRNPTGPDAGEIWSGLVGEHIVSRSVRDSAAMLDCTSGPDVGDPYWAPPPVNSYLSDVGRDPGRMRIAFTCDSPSGDPVDANNWCAVIQTAKLLENHGHCVEEAGPKYDAAAYAAAFVIVMTANCAVYMEDGARALARMPGADNLEKINLWVLNEGRKQTGLDLLRAQGVIHQTARQIAKFFLDCDVLITPGLAMAPPPIGYLFADQDPDLVWSRMRGLGPFCHIHNGTGQPAMIVPAAVSDKGIPICVQLVARYGDENSLFRLAGQLEVAQPWKDRRPPVYA